MKKKINQSIDIKNSGHVFFVLFLLVSFLFYNCSAPKSSQQGKKYNYLSFGSADFPAYVESVTFANGNSLSATSSLVWGKWTVSFPIGEKPTAREAEMVGQVYRRGNFSISGLKASNSVSGIVSCTMVFLFDGKVHSCHLSIQGNSVATPIVPPVYIKLY